MIKILWLALTIYFLSRLVKGLLSGVKEIKSEANQDGQVVDVDVVGNEHDD